MEDLVLTIPTQDGAFIETLAQRMGSRNRREAAMLFVQNLSVRGGQPIPADERGTDALIDEKYNK